MLEKDYGCQFLAIPVDGSSEATAMFKSGEVDVFITKMGDMAGAVENGYHPIVVFAEERNENFPDCPTGKELGIDYISFAARGYAYAAGVDQRIVDKMSQALVDAFYDTEYQESMKAAEQMLVLSDAEEYAQIMNDMLESRLYYWDIEAK